MTHANLSEQASFSVRRMTDVRPTLLKGESRTDYDVIVDQVWSALLPKDGIEEILAQDAINLFFEGRRLRRMKVAILREAEDQFACLKNIGAGGNRRTGTEP